MHEPIVDQTKMPDGRPHSAQPQWRQDFPITTGRSDYVARRDFVKFMVLTSAGFVVGQAWIGVKSMMRRMRGAPPILEIAAVADVPVGGVISFRYPSHESTCILIRPDENTFLAYDQKCTHLACAVLPRVEEGTLLCPCHAGSFDMATGRPTAGPPRRPLPRILLDIRDGSVYATGVELRT